ncbi:MULTISPECIES: ABC transporter ATP-binding protein [unclassified Mycoplasma]|uniref:ABC transporter ATP-binding protein n=1 Tax=unclassified Mycoplasma TaxID=2683645 RepID=UPI00211D0543|nr:MULTISPECIES: ABC transporter ATP-binding protein [unclassified Mycoplasma]UUM20121.1 ABC transporter ATP-binding protein/permease [Mycoplasma sp. 1578d]UUM25101.1 ABC transporter ATP-binding protein/permease [Mycoplasma sp. 3686d]
MRINFQGKDSFKNTPTIKLSYAEKKKFFFRLINLVWKEHKFIMSVVLVLILLSNVGLLFNQVFLGKILIDGLLTNPKTGGVFSWNDIKDDQNWWFRFYSMMALGVVLYTAGVSFNFLYQWIIVKITFKTMAKLRMDLYVHSQKLPIKFFDQNQKGEILSRYTSDIDTLRQFISKSIPITINAIVTLIISFVIMMWLSWILTLITLVLVCVILYAMKTLGQRSGKYFKKRQELNGKIIGFSEEIFSGLKVVKTFNQEDSSVEKFEKINNAYYNAEKKANRISNLLFPIAFNLGLITFAIVSIIGGVIISSPKAQAFFGLSVGVLFSFSQFSRSFAFPLSTVAEQSNVIITAIAGSKRVFDILDQEPEINLGKVTLVKITKDSQGNIIEKDIEDLFSNYAWKIPKAQGDFDYQPTQGKIEFKNVSFGYSDDNLILKNISLIAYPGQKIALVGPTGAGKTTITNVLNRFYEIQGGDVYFDDINLKDIDKSSLRQGIVMVLQDTHLFSETIRHNIAYGADTIQEQLMYSSADTANISYYINNLKHNYDTILFDGGSELSQGQRQLISIARAAYQDAPVVILDEATSSIDTKTEQLVQKAMDKLVSKRTSFVIAHRLSTIKNSDLILVLKDGSIIERGNHAQLIKQNGYYSALWSNSKVE